MPEAARRPPISPPSSASTFATTSPTHGAFVRAFDIPYPHIVDPNGEQLIRFAGALPPNGIPTTQVIDKQGRIAARVVGVISKSTLVALIRDTDQGR